MIAKPNPLKRRTKRLLTGLVDRTCSVLGRETVVRASRLVMDRAKLDVGNDMESNGERLLQEVVLYECAQRDCPCVVLDVGANQGEWSEGLLGRASSLEPRPRLDLHAFEPSSFTFRLLVQRLGRQQISMNNVALSDAPGVLNLHVVGAGAGTNSLHETSHSVPVVATEQVQVSTVDAYCLDAGIDHIALLKVDTEGHDYSVLAGAQDMIRRQAITAIQFEYNHRWVAARHYLRDAFDLLVPHGYSVGKVTPRGMEHYPKGWDPELEKFVEANYVAWLPTGLRAMPVIPWWKTR